MSFWIVFILWLLLLSLTQPDIIFYDNAEDLSDWTAPDVHIYHYDCLQGSCFDLYGYYYGQPPPSLTSIAISTANYQDIELQYWMKVKDLATDEECKTLYSVDGTNFVEIKSVTGTSNNAPQNVALSLPDTADNNPNLKIKFVLDRDNGNDGDQCYIDEVYVLGTPITITNNPTQSPTNYPTMAPIKNPTLTPSNNPTKAPTTNPSPVPTTDPTLTPTNDPTPAPTDEVESSKKPTTRPTRNVYICEAEFNYNAVIIISLSFEYVENVNNLSQAQLNNIISNITNEFIEKEVRNKEVYHNTTP